MHGGLVVANFGVAGLFATRYFTPKIPLSVSRRALDQQGGNHMPAFASQDVVGPAGRRGVHGLDAGAPRHQGLEPGRLRKADAGSAAENDQFGPELGKLREVFRAEFVETGAIPFETLPAGADHHAALDLFVVDRDPAGAVCGEGLGV